MKEAQYQEKDCFWTRVWWSHQSLDE